MVIVCKRNRFDFWNSCKRLQNFVNVEALTQRHMFGYSKEPSHLDGSFKHRKHMFKLMGKNDYNFMLKNFCFTALIFSAIFLFQSTTPGQHIHGKRILIKMQSLSCDIDSLNMALDGG